MTHRNQNSDKPATVLGIGGVTLDRIAVVPCVPEWDDICYITEHTVQQGGMVATAMVAARRLGVESKFIGGIGDDLEGEAVMDSFTREGVDACQVVQYPGERTAFSHVLVHGETGKRAILHSRGVQEKRSLTGINIDLNGVAIIHVDGFWYDTAVTELRKAKQSGIVTVIDPSSRIQRESDEEIFTLCDYIIPSYNFARKFTGNDDPWSMGEFFLRYGCRLACITNGDDGCYCVSGKDRFHIPSYTVTVKDTTGAGDVFHGAFCAGLVGGYGYKESLRFASAAAALKCSKLGGQAGIPSFHEVMDFMNAHGTSQYLAVKPKII